MPMCSDDERMSRLIDQARRQVGAARAPSGPAVTLQAASLPGYEIVREIHRGGQGIVYQALQRSTRRQVAIKVMREGPFADQTDRARFQREVEILARLKHPNIVAIHDSGQSGGCFFYVMDYIAGQTLDTFVATEDRSIGDLLEVFLKICEAVNAAHLQGVIHRDLKPSNIRVDADGEPFVLDFGLAKGQADEQQASLMTIAGQFVGSLLWASPEQAEGTPGKIDLRTDVYSLGVILFHVLTRRFPYDVTGSMRSVMDRIMRAAPIRPSTIRKHISSELETIVLKCLHKERERRYQSAGELARDIRHYLAGEPIEAKRDSTLYVLRKQFRRYRVHVAVALGFMTLLAVALVVITSLYVASERAYRAAAESERSVLWEAYVGNVIAADFALLKNDTVAMKRRLAAAPAQLRNWEWRYLLAESDTSLHVLGGHGSPTSSVAFHPDGAQLASVHGDGRARLWDVSSGRLERTLEGNHAHLTTVTFSPQGHWLAAGSEDGTTLLWDARNPDVRVDLGPAPGAVYATAFHPDASRLAVACRLAELTIWDPSSARRLDCPHTRDLQVHSLAYSPDGRRMAVELSNGEGHILNAVTGAAVTDLQGRVGKLNMASFSPDGTRLVSATGENAARLWDASTGEMLASFDGHTGGVYSAAFSPVDATRVASISDDMTVRLWDAGTCQQLALFRGHEHGLNQVAYSPDGRLLASASADGSVRLWDAGMHNYRALRRGHEAYVTAVVFSPDGERLASASEDSTIRLWDVTTGEPLAALTGHEGPVYDVAFNSGGTRLATGSYDHTVRIWNATTGESISVLRGHTDRVYAVAFSPVQPWLVSGSRDGTVRYWGLQNDAELPPDLAAYSGVGSVVFNTEGTRLAYGSDAGQVSLYNPVTGQELQIHGQHDGPVYSLAFSRDGTLMASGSEDGTVCVWNTATGERTLALHGHVRRVHSVTFSPDGTRLASGARDGQARVWDIRTGEPVLALRAPAESVRSVAFSPDGTRLAGAVGRSVYIWDAVPARDRFRQRQDRLLALAQIQPLVTDLIEELRGVEPAALRMTRAAERLRRHPSLTGRQRQAALDLVAIHAPAGVGVERR